MELPGSDALGFNFTEMMSKFYKLSHKERLERVRQFCNLTDEEVALLAGQQPLSIQIAENLIENVLGYFPVPLGVVTYLRVDGRPILVPMAVEETSIIAAVSKTAKWIEENKGTVETKMKGNLIIGQVQIPSVLEAEAAVAKLVAQKDALIEFSNRFVSGLVRRGGGVKDLEFRTMNRSDDSSIQMLVVHVLCDPCDAMGANLINQVCEALKPRIEEITGEKVGLCILSNLVDTKIARAVVRIPGISASVASGIQEASIFAETDPYRATTHNKGVLNGIDPILIATGNDWRAVEAGIHAFASRSGQYQPITRWRFLNGVLEGVFEAPLAVGTVGGVTRVHPFAKVALKMMNVQSSADLSRICAAVGLVQNLAAVKALSTDGIVQGHMKLHASNLAIAAGADLSEVEPVRLRLESVLQKEKYISLSLAKEFLDEIRQKHSSASTFRSGNDSQQLQYRQ